MARPRTTKTTYPGLVGPRTRRVTTYANGNREATYTSSGVGLVGEVVKAFAVVLLLAVILAVLVVLLLAAAVGAVAKSEPMKRAPKAWVSLWVSWVRERAG